MLRRISALLLAVLLMLTLASSVALAAPPEGKGVPRAEEPKSTGSPDDPTTEANEANNWGSVASQLGNEGIMGQHSSDPVPFVPGREVPRDGLGNVSRNDAGNEGTDPAADTGSRISDHACIAAARPVPGTTFQPSCEAEPGQSA